MTKKNRQALQTTTQAPTPMQTPMDLIAHASAGGASIEKMEQLFDLQLRWEENEAKKAYYQAVAAFKAEAIDIIKNKRVSYRTDKGNTDYNHAELGMIVNTVSPLLSKHGLSSHWEYAQEKGAVKVTCFLTHAMGYERSTSLEAPPDNSGGKNTIQAIGSSTSYLERYTFMAMTGLASREKDDDGRGSGPAVERMAKGGKPNVAPPQTVKNGPVPGDIQEAEVVSTDNITEGQIKTVQTKLTKAGRNETDLITHLKKAHGMKVKALTDIKRSDLTAVIMEIDAGSVPQC